METIMHLTSQPRNIYNSMSQSRTNDFFFPYSFYGIVSYASELRDINSQMANTQNSSKNVSSFGELERLTFH